MIQVTPEIVLDEREIEQAFIRASGPGGQHVNKAATAVQLRFDGVRERLKRLAGNRMTESGVLVVEAKRFRTQEQNRQDALKRLVALIREASRKPKPRHKTKPTRASKERRLRNKRRRSEIKKLRRDSWEY
jgi:ribosome-associated protein